MSLNLGRTKHFLEDCVFWEVPPGIRELTCTPPEVQRQAESQIVLIAAFFKVSWDISDLPSNAVGWRTWSSSPLSTWFLPSQENWLLLALLGKELTYQENGEMTCHLKTTTVNIIIYNILASLNFLFFKSFVSLLSLFFVFKAKKNSIVRWYSRWKCLWKMNNASN